MLAKVSWFSYLCLFSHVGILGEAKRRMRETTGHISDGKEFAAAILRQAHHVDDSYNGESYHKKTTEQIIRECLDRHSMEIDKKLILVQDYLQNNMVGKRKKMLVVKI